MKPKRERPDVRLEKFNIVKEVLNKDYPTGPTTPFAEQRRLIQLKNEYGLIKFYTIGVFSLIAILLSIWIFSKVFNPILNGLVAAKSVDISNEAQLAFIERAQRLCATVEEGLLNQISKIVTFFLSPVISILTLLIGYVFGRREAEGSRDGAAPDDESMSKR